MYDSCREAEVTGMRGWQPVPQRNLEGGQLPVFRGGAGMPHFPNQHHCLSPLKIQVTPLEIIAPRPLPNSVAIGHLGR